MQPSMPWSQVIIYPVHPVQNPDPLQTKCPNPKMLKSWYRKLWLTLQFCRILCSVLAFNLQILSPNDMCLLALVTIWPRTWKVQCCCGWMPWKSMPSLCCSFLCGPMQRRPPCVCSGQTKFVNLKWFLVIIWTFELSTAKALGCELNTRLHLDLAEILTSPHVLRTAVILPLNYVINGLYSLNS